jgi:putative SOS response-associated peptidase YedK
MSGRNLTPDEAAIERHWGLKAPSGYMRSYNVAPTQTAAVVLRGAGGLPSAKLLIWGFRPYWTERSWINARVETVFTTKAFAMAARSRRCLVPALGWYEWQAAKTPKQPFLQHRPSFEPLSFAGIWTSIATPEGPRRSFAILTKPALPAIEAIHSRMPVVLEESAYERWLDPGLTVAEARRLLEAPGPEISAYPVSAYVNKPEHDDERCMAPVPSL